MSASRPPRRHNELGEVAACDCGGVNLSLGALTLHVAADEVALLDELVRAAVVLARPVERRKRRRAASSARPQGNTLH